MKVIAPFAAVVLAAVASPVVAQECCGAPTAVQAYRLEYQQAYEERQVTAYRLEYETVYEPRQVTSYKPVWETQIRERRYSVARPVYETSEREERYTVQRPVYETQLRDESYDVVRNVYETAEREERYTVQKPVWETSVREERYTVRRPVYETSEREEAYTVMEPVTTYRPVQVDQGQYVTQYALQPGAVRNRLAWQPRGYQIDPRTGVATYSSGGLWWTPMQAPAALVPQTVYQPNIVTQQVAETSLVPRTEVRKVPVQTVRYVDEEVVRQIPTQVCRMITEEQVRKVPVTVCKQVVERVEKQVPVQVCRMVTEEVVKKVPVTTMKTVYEERVEQDSVRVCRYEAVAETVQVAKVVEKRVPVTYAYRVPHYIVNRVPLDACGNPITSAPSTSGSLLYRETTPSAAKSSDAATDKPTLDKSVTPEPIDESKVKVNKPTEAPAAEKEAASTDGAPKK